MNLSFFTAATGADAHQTRLNIISNNIANVNTEGFRAQRAGFVDLLYEHYYEAATRDPETGSGARVEKTDILFRQGGVIPTGGAHDFAIVGDGFFAVYNPETEMIFYTRQGHFMLSNFGGNTFFLATPQGYLVLDNTFAPIQVDTFAEDQELNIGVFDFILKEGMILRGNNLFETVENNGEPFVSENFSLIPGHLEMSNVDLAHEMSQVIEAQRAFQFNLRMVQTSDEIQNTIINLR